MILRSCTVINCCWCVHQTCHVELFFSCSNPLIFMSFCFDMVSNVDLDRLEYSWVGAVGVFCERSCWLCFSDWLLGDFTGGVLGHVCVLLIGLLRQVVFSSLMYQVHVMIFIINCDHWLCYINFTLRCWMIVRPGLILSVVAVVSTAISSGNAGGGVARSGRSTDLLIRTCGVANLQGVDLEVMEQSDPGAMSPMLLAWSSLGCIPAAAGADAPTGKNSENS